MYCFNKTVLRCLDSHNKAVFILVADDIFILNTVINVFFIYPIN